MREPAQTYPAGSALRELLAHADGDPVRAAECAVRLARAARQHGQFDEAAKWGRAGLRAARLAAAWCEPSSEIEVTVIVLESVR